MESWPVHDTGMGRDYPEVPPENGTVAHSASGPVRRSQSVYDPSPAVHVKMVRVTTQNELEALSLKFHETVELQNQARRDIDSYRYIRAREIIERAQNAEKVRMTVKTPVVRAQFSLDNGIKVEQAYANQGVWLVYKGLYAFITDEELVELLKASHREHLKMRYDDDQS